MVTAHDWMEEAKAFIGLKEIKGPRHNATILKWLVALRAWWHDDETPWCGVFVAQCMQFAGFALPKNWMRAQAWLDWGVQINQPAYGCVVVFGRKGGGHVGFVAGFDRDGRIMVLGGNQGDQVSIVPFDHTRVLGYRWPVGLPLDWSPLPILDSNLESSVNEA